MSRTRRVAVIIDLSWAYQHHHGVFVGTQHFARQCGYWDCTVAAHADPELKFPGTNEHYDGIIARATPQLAARASRAKIPLVNVFLNTAAKGLVTVAPDREAAGRMAAEHLLARGFHHFGCLGFNRDRTSKQQLTGFQDVLRGHGWQCNTQRFNKSFDQHEQGWRRFIERIDGWIDTWTPPIGVLATVDIVARYLAEACRRRGLKIPHDAALIGTQNEPVICLQPDPTLTSIDVGYERVGFEAARLLDLMMDGEKPLTRCITVPPKELVPRGSTDVYMVSDPLVSQALRFMAEHGHEGIQVPEVAKAVVTARRTLERRFQAALGRPIAEELTRLKVERVKRQLVETDETVGAIARQCGFTDGKQMGKTFTRIVGVPPREFRSNRRTE